MPVRIAFNALALRPGGTGVQTYIRELLHAMANRYAGDDVTLLAVVQHDAAGEVPDGIQVRGASVAAGLRRALLGLRSVGPADLVHGLDVDAPLRPGAPLVVTVHDMTPFDVPWAMSKRKATGERVLYRQAIARADAVIAVSAFTAERVKAVFDRDATVVHEGTPSDLHPADDAAIADVRARYRLPETFVLHVGTIEPRKDVATVASACAAAGVELVLAGRAPSHHPDVGRARLLGYVPRADLAALYGAATITSFPTRYEGFGLPPLEAMRCGSAVIASDVSSLPEVLGQGALLVRPSDVEAWTKAITELVNDGARRDEVRAAGRARADALTWDDAALGTAAVYRELGVPLD